jgi:hypothetical protein
MLSLSHLLTTPPYPAVESGESTRVVPKAAAIITLLEGIIFAQ